MSVTLERTGASRTMKSGRNEKNGRRITWLIIFAVLLGVSILASLTVGLKSLSPDSIVETLAGQSTPESHAIIFEQRIPRTLIGIACGAAPALTPIRPGSASGLRVSDCMSDPASGSI